MNKKDFARSIDHTLLKPQATKAEVEQAIAYGREVGSAAVCIHPMHVQLAKKMLMNTNTAVCTVVGFPLGLNTMMTKAREAGELYANGARELDMVMNMNAMKSGDYEYVRRDIEAVVYSSDAIVKVIIETCYLTDEEIATASKLVEEAGAQYVKTSTGFGPAGANLEHIRIIRESISPAMKIKAAGGIGDVDTAISMLIAGCSRIGTSRTAQLLEGMAE